MRNRIVRLWGRAMASEAFFRICGGFETGWLESLFGGAVQGDGLDFLKRYVFVVFDPNSIA